MKRSLIVRSPLYWNSPEKLIFEARFYALAGRAFRNKVLVEEAGG